MRDAVAERRRADFDIPALLPRVCSHIRGAVAERSRSGRGAVAERSRSGRGAVAERSRSGRGAVAERSRSGRGAVAERSRSGRGADAGRSAISRGQWWFGARGFEAGAANWVLDPFLAERILLPLRLRSATAHVWTHVRVRFHLRGAVTTARSRFLAYSVFMLCVSTTAGRKRDGGRCPRRVRRNGSWSHFSVPPWGAVAVLRQLVLRLLKYRSRDVDIKILRLLWNWTGDSAVVLLIRLSNIKMIGELYESPGFDISRNLSIRHLNSFLNRASNGRVVMLMKTEWELCSDMTIICLHYYKGRGFLYR